MPLRRCNGTTAARARASFVHEPVPGLLGGEQAVPRGPDRLAVELGDHAGIALAAPVPVVALEHRVGERGDHLLTRPVGVPRGRLVQHLSKERVVLVRRGPDVHDIPVPASEDGNPSAVTVGIARASYPEPIRADDVRHARGRARLPASSSTLALSLVGLALLGLAENVLPFELPPGTKEQFANLTGSSATLARELRRAPVDRVSPVAASQSGARGHLPRRTRGGWGSWTRITLGLVVLVGGFLVVTWIVLPSGSRPDLEIPFRVLGFAATTAMEFGLFLLAYAQLTPGTIGWRSTYPARPSHRSGGGCSSSREGCCSLLRLEGDAAVRHDRRRGRPAPVPASGERAVRVRRRAVGVPGPGSSGNGSPSRRPIRPAERGYHPASMTERRGSFRTVVADPNLRRVELAFLGST